ncbi:MAG: hypothetical protein E7207_01970 [Clostridium butyricum]|nr:hypothetical protein [Clostridium butyricum]
MKKSFFKYWGIFFLLIVVATVFLLKDTSNLIPKSILAPKINTDINKYQEFIGENAKEEFKNKWGMDEKIFPKEIATNMNVEDYKMVYQNFGDFQCLSYLVVEYDEDAYKREVERLNNYNSTEYIGNYGAIGFDSKYKLLAMNADSYSGFVYALTNKKDTIIYVEMIFCNYTMDLNYKKYINQEYLPLGFNAEQGNPYAAKK